MYGHACMHDVTASAVIERAESALNDRTGKPAEVQTRRR
jgi:hypothetical protein